MKHTLLSLFFGLVLMTTTSAQPTATDNKPNLAVVAAPSTSYVSQWETLEAINDGAEPKNSIDRSHTQYGNYPEQGTQWVQLTWAKPITTDLVQVYWFSDRRGIEQPASARLLYKDGDNWIPVEAQEELGVEVDQYNTLVFKPVTTPALRLEMTSRDEKSTGIIEWRVLDQGSSPDFPPLLEAGPDRTVVTDADTFLNASTIDAGQQDAERTTTWTALDGPGTVTFKDPSAPSTSASFSAPGTYTLQCKATVGGQASTDTLTVHVVPAPPVADLNITDPAPYTVTSDFWQPRLKALIVNWIPHCIAKCEEPDLKEGGLNNLLEAAKKIRGETDYKPHIGYMFSNAWVLNTIEAMCVAQMVDPQGDQEIIDAQAAMLDTLEEWIPIVLAAQEPDGYFQTRYTLGYEWEQGKDIPRWSAEYRTQHEGYVAGYFIEAAIAHYRMTEGKDRRLYDAAIRLADCWYDHIGPAPKQAWFDEHQGMEMALFRLAHLVNQVEGNGAGDKYAELSRFLLDCRGHEQSNGKYDQSHLPVTEQYTAEGHAVRAVYLYSAMTEVARRWDDADYQSAVLSLWDNLVNRKYYVTGGIGSGETSEGFGEDYSLPHNAYCESCSGIGTIFFQHQLNLLTGNAKYADLYEETLYNAVLSDIDLEGQNFTYTNALDTNEQRYKWHVCPCCVGNIPRALLVLPTWTYSSDDENLFVNLYVGSRMTVPGINGQSIEVVQDTSYPRDGNIKITINPQSSAEFAIHLRDPDRSVSEIYSSTPEAPGMGSITVNGTTVAAEAINGYRVLLRQWQPGDTIEFELPMPIQRVHSIPQAKANLGRVALRRGPLMFNIEEADQNLDLTLAPDAELHAEYDPDTLDGVLTIRGKFSNGAPLKAIPNYARNNRPGRSIVWIHEESDDSDQ